MKKPSIASALATLCSIWLLVGGAQAIAAEIPLFADQQVLEITVRSDFPFRSYNHKQQQGDRPERFPKFAAAISYEMNGARHSQQAKLQARGSGRLSHCRFAPYKIDFDESAEGLFQGITNNLKVVSHCDEGDLFRSVELAEESVMKEYILYRILNALPMISFKVRPLKIRYEKADGTLDSTRFAFAIEPVKNLLKRSPDLSRELDENWSTPYQEKLDSGKYTVQQLTDEIMNLVNHRDHVINGLAQFLILNDDFAGTIFTGNAKSFVKTDGTFSKVHYDFDLSRLTGKFERGGAGELKYPSTIEASSDAIWIKNYCSLEEEMIITSRKEVECRKAFAELLPLKTNVLKVIEEFKLLPEAKKTDIVARVESFFGALALLKASEPRQP